MQAVKQLNKTEIRAGHTIHITIATFDPSSQQPPPGFGVTETAPKRSGGSRWGGQKAPAGGVITGMSGLQGVLPSALQGFKPPVIESKQAMAARKAAEIAKQMESLKGLINFKK